MQGANLGFARVVQIAALVVAPCSREPRHVVARCEGRPMGPGVACRSRYRQAGFTFIELMVTVTVVAILAVVALPNLRGVVNSNRLRSSANETIAVLQAARMEAIRANRLTVACMSADPNAATPVCGAAGATGWVVFQDADHNGQYAASERLVRRATVTGKVQLLGSPSFGKGVAFGSDGLARDVGGGLLNAVVAVCLPTNEPQDNESDVSISAGSRIRASRKSAAGKCLAPGDVP